MLLSASRVRNNIQTSLTVVRLAGKTRKSDAVQIFTATMFITIFKSVNRSEHMSRRHFFFFSTI